ncbi:MAG: hypothetical protein MJ154_01460 [Candidatus Saccharibacteria bacterium]|nr:hypothetical protein [Candidatus Saccharibacteria bacterium]
MSINPESGGNNPEEKTPREQKIEKLINLFEQSRTPLEDFRGLKNYPKLDDDISQADLKEASFTYSETDDSYDNAFESILYYMGTQKQLFDQDAFAEPGSRYDDLFNGADVVFGLKQAGTYDTVFNVDACTAMDLRKVREKFKNSSKTSESVAPGCNNLFYYAHGPKRTRIIPSPHYIIGTTVANVANAVDKFNIDDAPNISNEVDKPLRTKILIELFYQSHASSLECNIAEKAMLESTDLKKKGKIEKAHDAHKNVHFATRESLFKIFGIEAKNTKSKEARLKLEEKLNVFYRQYASEDDVFKEIFDISKKRRDELLETVEERNNAKFGKNVKAINDILNNPPKSD